MGVRGFWVSSLQKEPKAMIQPDRRHTPWCIICMFPNAQTVIVKRFRRRSDAEEALRLLRRLQPEVLYGIVFDVGRSDR